MSGSGRDDDDAANGLKPKPKADTVAHAATPQPGADHAQQLHAQQRQQHHGADAAHQVKPGAGTLVSPGIGGLFTRPAYKQDLTYQSRESPGPVAPLHGPGETPQVPVTLPPALTILTMNPMVLANHLRIFIPAAQYAEIHAAAADRVRLQALVRVVFEQITAQVNASANGAAKAALLTAAAMPGTALDNYYKAATLLRRQGPGGVAPVSTSVGKAPAQGIAPVPGADVTGLAAPAHAPTSATLAPSLMYQAAQPAAPSMLAVAPAPRFDQLPMMMPPTSMLAVAPGVASLAPAAKPAAASPADPSSLAPPRSAFQALPRFDTMPRPAPQPAGFAPLSNVLDTNVQPQVAPTTFAGQAAQSQAAHEARGARGHELLDAVQGWDAAITDHISRGNVDGEADAVAAGLRKIESILRADAGALPVATNAALKSLTRHAQQLSTTCGTHGQAVLHSALMAMVTAAGDRGVTLDVLWNAASAAAGGGNVSDAELLTQLQQSGRLLAHAQERLGGWRLGAATAWLASAQQRVAGHVAHLQSKTSIKDARIRARASVQAQTLRDASGEFDAVRCWQWQLGINKAKAQSTTSL